MPTRIDDITANDDQHAWKAFVMLPVGVGLSTLWYAVSYKIVICESFESADEHYMA